METTHKGSNENDTVTIEPKVELHRGRTLPWNHWKTMNMYKAKCIRTRKNLFKWGLSEDGKCECGGVQDDEHNIYIYTMYNVHII